jgi:predicted nucleic acid-binding protein
VIAATVLAEENQISFSDAMIVRSAAEMHCDTLWSEDLNDGQQIAGVRISNPFRN